MSERQPYTYVLLRYRHDPLAGEFANVGVVLHAPRAPFLGARLRTVAGTRLTKMFPGMNVKAFRAGLQAIDRGLAKLASGDASGLLSGLSDAAVFARRVLPVDDTSYVWAPVGSGLTDDPEVTLGRLYERFVARYDSPSRVSTHGDATVWRPVQDLLMARHLDERLAPKEISSPTVNIEFEHAWKNGAWHVYQPLSFDLTSEATIQDKAGKWAGYLLGLREADEDFKPHFIVGAPRDSQLMDAYKRALDLLHLAKEDAEIVQVSDAGELVDRIEAEVRAHDTMSAG